MYAAQVAIVTDILFETVRAIITGIIFLYLSIKGRRQHLDRQQGWLLIQFGFGLLLIGSLVDITDNFPALDRFVIVGQTGYEAFLEKIVGYTMGFLLLAVGFWKWLPTVITLSKTQDALRESEARFRSIYNGIGIGVALIGKDMEILSINPQMQKWFPHIESGQRSVCYRSFNVPPRDKVCDYCPTVHTLKDGQVHAAVTETPTAEGLRYYQIISTPLLLEDGSISAAIEMVEDITEQKRAEERLQLAERKYRSLVEMTDTGYVILDSQGRVIDANQKYIDLSGRTGREDVIGHSVLEWTAPYDQNRNAEEVRKCIQQGRVRSLQIDYMDPAGNITPIEIDATVLDGEESFTILSLCRDINERKKAETALIESERRYRIFFDQSPDGVLLMNAKGDIVDFSDKVSRQLGYSREEFSRLQISDIDPVESPADISERFEKVLKNGKDEFEVKHRTKQGDIRDVLVIIQTLPLSGQTFFHAIWRDITDSRRAEEARLASERMLQAIIETEPECVKLLDENANLIMMNRAGLDMIGADSMEQVKGQCICPLVTSEYREPFMDLNRRVFQGGSGTLLFEVVGLKERHVWLETHAVPLRNEKDEIIALLGVTRDVTERKQFEEKLRQSEEFVRGILDTVDEGFIVIDRDYRILTANRAYCSQMGGCDQNIIGSHCYEISHKIDRPCFEEGEECAVRQTFETGAPHSALHRHKDANGTILYVETKAFPIKDDSGKITSVIETINNITEKYLLEEERLKTQKLESIGTLAGGIAHDFNNLLQGVFGYISMAKMTLDQKETSLAMLEQAEEALHLSVNLTTQLLTFSKGGKPMKKLMSLESTIENAVKFALSGSHTDYTLDIVPGLWSVEADAGQLAQVIQNIVLNANEAMAGRGTVTIAVKNMDIPPKTNLRLPDGGRFVRIDIQDTGTGISGQNMTKIFDPYFTTKQRGSGLGLATSYSIIRNHGGLIEVRSEINRGTTFTIYLPASKETEVKTAATAPAAEGTKKGRILLMDDEDLVRTVAHQMITALGHYAVSTEDGEKAIDTFREAKEKGRPFDLVILDLTVKGGMGGEEAVAKILEIDPHVKVIVSSGYADNPVVADYRAYGFSGVLNKPYRLDDLKSCLNLFFS